MSMTAPDGFRDVGSASAAGAITRQSAVARARLIEPWRSLRTTLTGLLEAADHARPWLEGVGQVVEQVRHLTAQDADVGLYLMLQTAMNDLDNYSASHALYCGVVSELCTSWFEWPKAEADALLNAALTMNLGMVSMQDALARQVAPLSDEQRQRIDAHPGIGVDLLKAAGVVDALWLETVRRHHRPVDPSESPDPLQAAQRLAKLLQRIDVFTAKLSKRKTRAGASATVAARDACLDGTGTPDATGATMLRVLGLYPPGSYVELANGDVGVVTFRGAKAHTPVVACLLRGNGAFLNQPQLRNTAVSEYSVRQSLSASEVRVAVVHQRVLSAQW